VRRPFASGALPATLRAPAVIALVAATVGAIVAWRYHQLGLTLSHYDARGHLIVARRIADSITPGWQQIGAVWLPLPHLLNALPVQVDLFYRTGASGVAISIAAFAIATGAIGWIVMALTESAGATAAATAVFALNPNVLYLQSTPMTEPLLLATTTVAVAMLIAWSRADRGASEDTSSVTAEHADATRAPGSDGRPTLMEGEPFRRAGSALLKASRSNSHGEIGCAFALACLTRYEAWPVTISALGAAVWARWRRGVPLGAAVRDVSAIAVYPAVAILTFFVFSRVVIGEWFVASGFFVPENKALSDPMMAAAEIGWGTRMLSGVALTWLGAAGAAIAMASGLLNRRRAESLIAVSLLAMAAVPWTAFVKGHPFRIRYMVPLTAMEAIGAGIVVGVVTSRRARIVFAIALLILAGYELRPFDASAPMVVEAEWDRPNAPVRARVTACLGDRARGEKVMASMGSLGHYMQEASRSGFAIRDFLHEGNGDIWLAALESPLPFVNWILVEEKAEGGDMLARLARDQPSFLQGYERICEGAGLVLYRKQDHG